MKYVSQYKFKMDSIKQSINLIKLIKNNKKTSKNIILKFFKMKKNIMK